MYKYVRTCTCVRTHVHVRTYMYMYVRMRPFRGARRKMSRAHAAGRVETQSVIYDTGMSFTYNSPPDSGHYPYVRMASIRYANTCMQSCVSLMAA